MEKKDFELEERLRNKDKPKKSSVFVSTSELVGSISMKKRYSCRFEPQVRKIFNPSLMKEL